MKGKGVKCQSCGKEFVNTHMIKTNGHREHWCQPCIDHSFECVGCHQRDILELRCWDGDEGPYCDNCWGTLMDEYAHMLDGYQG